MKNELMKAALFDDLNTILDDVELLLKDYDYDVEAFIENDYDENDDDIHTIITLYTQMRHVLEQ